MPVLEFLESTLKLDQTFSRIVPVVAALVDKVPSINQIIFE